MAETQWDIIQTIGNIKTFAYKIVTFQTMYIFEILTNKYQVFQNAQGSRWILLFGFCVYVGARVFSGVRRSILIYTFQTISEYYVSFVWAWRKLCLQWLVNGMESELTGNMILLTSLLPHYTLKHLEQKWA